MFPATAIFFLNFSQSSQKVELIFRRHLVNFTNAGFFRILMDESQKNDGKNQSSFGKFLSNPLIKADSKSIQYSGLGITLVVTILIFFWIGRWLDGQFNTNVLFTLILSFVGFAAGFYSFYLNIKKLTEEEKKDNPKFKKS